MGRPTPGRPGRPKKYSKAKDLLAAVNAYFDGITDSRGAFRRAPSVAGICLALGIARSTWYTYAEDKRLKAVVEWARLVIEDYWSDQLAGKFANGAKFALGSGFGWNKAARWSEREPETREPESGVVILPPVEEEAGDG